MTLPSCLPFPARRDFPSSCLYQLQQPSSPISFRPSSCLYQLQQPSSPISFRRPAVYQLQQASSPIFPSVQLSTSSSRHLLPSSRPSSCLPAPPGIFSHLFPPSSRLPVQRANPMSARQSPRSRPAVSRLPSLPFPIHILTLRSFISFCTLLIYLFFLTFPLPSKRCIFGPKSAKLTAFLSVFRPKMSFISFLLTSPKRASSLIYTS